MSLMMCGTISANKTMTEVIDIITDVLGNGGWYVHENEIHFYEFYGYRFEEYLDDLVNKLKPLGYTLKGSVFSYGDYGDGRYDLDGEEIEYIAEEDFSLHDATDEELIKILENRGYIITKKEIE